MSEWSDSDGGAAAAPDGDVDAEEEVEEAVDGVQRAVHVEWAVAAHVRLQVLLHELLVHLQQEARRERRVHSSVQHEQNDHPVPDGFERRVVQNDEAWDGHLSRDALGLLHLQRQRLLRPLRRSAAATAGRRRAARVRRLERVRRVGRVRAPGLHAACPHALHDDFGGRLMCALISISV